MFVYPKKYDIIVVGAGHAGVEAALAAARMGCQVLLLTTNADSIGQMSCNPAIGGLAKGHLVREIDALGGEMGKNADMSGLQFRMLNTGRGPAVWAPRAQCDKKTYQFRLKWICERESYLEVKQDQTVRILHRDNVAYGVETKLEVQYVAKVIVITTGTFLRGLMHIGSNRQQGGRSGEVAALDLSKSLAEVGLELGRLKTGTPPRLLKRSIDFSKTDPQHGDTEVPYFTYWKNDLFHVEQNNGTSAPTSNKFPPNSILSTLSGQLPCFVTYTTEQTREIITKNLHRSPMYSGVIEGIGPRYCPSIEDKIVRFPEKERQQIFLEPEGIATDEVYVNGFSTSLPYEVQIDLVKTIIGCEKAEIVRPAYAVEYDFVFPTQLNHSLEAKTCQNLFLAGQINGTSGYEEAAAQGIMAGINAVRKIRNQPAIVLRRDQAYIGVLIDDLVMKGTSEPYRMFTSRAEHRLALRQDNADQRLSAIGYEVGLLGAKNFSQYLAKQSSINDELVRLENTRVGSESLLQMLRKPECGYKDLPSFERRLSAEVVEQLEIIVKYEGYIARQNQEVDKLKKLEHKEIPLTLNYDSIPSLRTEARQKLSKIRPANLGQAARISGVSPADIGILMVYMKKFGETNKTVG